MTNPYLIFTLGDVHLFTNSFVPAATAAPSFKTYPFCAEILFELEGEEEEEEEDDPEWNVN